MAFSYRGRIYTTENLSLLHVQFNGLKNIYIAMTPSPLAISGTFPSLQSETLNPLNNNSYFPTHSIPAPGNHSSTFSSS